MRKIYLWILACTLFNTAVMAETVQPAYPDDMVGGFSMEKAEVLKVYAAEEQGARFRAYVVEWKGQEVVVSDTLGSTDKKVGDTVRFMAHRMEMPHQGQTLKILQFQIMEFPGMDMSVMDHTTEE